MKKYKGILLATLTSLMLVTACNTNTTTKTPNVKVSNKREDMFVETSGVNKLKLKEGTKFTINKYQYKMIGTFGDKVTKIDVKEPKDYKKGTADIMGEVKEEYWVEPGGFVHEIEKIKPENQKWLEYDTPEYNVKLYSPNATSLWVSENKLAGIKNTEGEVTIKMNVYKDTEYPYKGISFTGNAPKETNILLRRTDQGYRLESEQPITDIVIQLNKMDDTPIEEYKIDTPLKYATFGYTNGIFTLVEEK